MHYQSANKYLFYLPTPTPPAKAGQALQGGEFHNTLKNNII